VVGYFKNILGGALLLLPLFKNLYAFSALSFSYELTDNLYLLNRKENGNILNLEGYINKSLFFSFENETNFYLLNFDDSTLIFENLLQVAKKFTFKNFGNKDKIYANFYIFHTPFYKIYRHVQVSAGNFYKVYLKERCPLSVNLEFFRKEFISHSLDEQRFFTKASISIPMPYFFLIPFLSHGIKDFLDKNFYFYEAGVNFDFPLNFEHSFFISLEYEFFNFPDGIIFLPENPYTQDPFFEEAFIREKLKAGVEFRKIFIRKAMEIYFNSSFCKENFIYDERNDREIKNSLSLLKFLNKNLFLNIKFENTLNFSNISEFEYTKNALNIKAGLIF